jgi:hypothetical protein
MQLFWSVERDRDTVLAICPEPLRRPDGSRPGWMEQCASAIREELRVLAVEQGTLLAATLTTAPAGVDMATALLSHRGIPQAHVQAGVRFALLPAAERGVELRYRRERVASAVPDDSGSLVARLQVPVSPSYELQPGAPSWLAPIPGDPDGGPGLSLRARFTEGAARVHGSVELIESLLGTARACLTPPGTTLDIRALEVVFAPGDPALLEVELRVLPASGP